MEAAAITPGLAKRYQSGTEPSAKSTHCVPVVGIRLHAPGSRGEGGDEDRSEDEKAPHVATFYQTLPRERGHEVKERNRLLGTRRRRSF